MNVVAVVIAVVIVALIVVALSIRVVTQYEKGVWFRLGRVIGVREPGLRFIIPVIDRLWKVSLRIVTMPIQSQGIITRDNVSIDVSAVAYYRVIDATKSVVAIENVAAAINQIAQTTLRNVVGQHTLDQTLAETDRINLNIREKTVMTRHSAVRCAIDGGMRPIKKAGPRRGPSTSTRWEAQLRLRLTSRSACSLRST